MAHYLLFRFILILISLLSFLLGNPLSSSAKNAKVEVKKECDGPFKDGSKPNLETLNRILKEHEKWLTSRKKPKRDGKQANLCNADLRETNLTMASLTDANLTRASLEDANLTGAGLNNANLTRASLTDANLFRAYLNKANLFRAYLGHANLTKAKLDHANLTEAQFWEANLTEASLTDANLFRAYLNKANLFRAYLGHANLTEAKLDHANLTRASLTDANLAGASLNGANLTGASLNKTNLTKANLAEANLAEANLAEGNLTEADLDKANLTKADLVEANLTKAFLVETDLTKAFLVETDLTKAVLFRANLTKANLAEANLTRAILAGANLTKAKLAEANLTEADLDRAILTGADLNRAILTDARIQGTNFTNVYLDLKPGALPFIPDFGLVQKLSQVSYRETPHTLVELRQEFKDAGMRQQEREVTYAIERTKRERQWENGSLIEKIGAIFKFIFFELTCQYGMLPGRPLQILIILIPCFGAIYSIVVTNPGAPENESPGIWAIFHQDRIKKAPRGGRDNPVKVTAHFFFHKTHTWLINKGGNRITPIVNFVWKMIAGIYFSILSTFHIGWRDLNVGAWISRIQPHEYALRATGWVRTVSGFQSLLSVYLLALWALTYFGRPFE